MPSEEKESFVRLGNLAYYSRGCMGVLTNTRICFVALIVILATNVSSCKKDVRCSGNDFYFPSGSLSTDRELDRKAAVCFSNTLRGLSELPLCSKRYDHSEVYRLFWDDISARSGILRLLKGDNNTYKLTRKLLDKNMPCFNPGQPDEYKKLVSEVSISLAEFRKLTSCIHMIDLWSMEGTTEQVGVDCVHWVLEARHKDKYHVVYRWCVDDGPLIGCINSVLKLSEEIFSESAIYLKVAAESVPPKIPIAWKKPSGVLSRYEEPLVGTWYAKVGYFATRVSKSDKLEKFSFYADRDLNTIKDKLTVAMRGDEAKEANCIWFELYADRTGVRRKCKMVDGVPKAEKQSVRLQWYFEEKSESIWMKFSEDMVVPTIEGERVVYLVFRHWRLSVGSESVEGHRMIETIPEHDYTSPVQYVYSLIPKEFPKKTENRRQK